MFVKICGVTNERDALLAVALGADALGFVFAPSARQVSPLRVKEIVRNLPSSVITVGVFRDELPQRVIETVRDVGLIGAQLHGHESARTVAEVMNDVKWVTKSVVAGSIEATHADDYMTNLILVDSAIPGSGIAYDRALVQDLPKGLRVILSGGLNPENVCAAIDLVMPWGVDVSSGVEKAPGHKDPVKLRQFIANARLASEQE